MKLPRLPRFNIRDLFWLVLVVALALGWWLENSRARRLGIEVKYLKSVVPPQSFMEVPLENVIGILSRVHDVRIDVDWESLKAEGYTPKMLVTHNLQEGSLTKALSLIFLVGRDNVRIVPHEEGIRITTKDAAGTDALELRSHAGPHVGPDTKRLFRLLRAVEAEGYRVTFEKAERPGQEEVTLERLSD